MTKLIFKQLKKQRLNAVKKSVQTKVYLFFKIIYRSLRLSQWSFRIKRAAEKTDSCKKACTSKRSMSILVGLKTGGRSDWPLLEQARALQLRDSDGITPFFPRFLLRLTPEKPDLRTLARFHQMRIIFISSFQNVSPMALGPLPSLIDTHPLPTKQNIEAVGFMHGHANAQCHWAQALDRSVRMSSPEQMPRRLFSWNRPSQEL